MAEKKIVKSSIARPKAAKAKAKPVKAKAKPTAKSTPQKAKPASKKANPVSVTSDPIAKEGKIPTRKYAPRKSKGNSPSYTELLRKEAELATIKQKTKAELRKAYDKKQKETEGIKKQYHDIFHESLDSAAKPGKHDKSGLRSSSRRRLQAAPYTKEEIEGFIQQKKQGIDVSSIKIKGRRPQSIHRIDEAYENASTKDPVSILALLK